MKIRIVLAKPGILSRHTVIQRSNGRLAIIERKRPLTYSEIAEKNEPFKERRVPVERNGHDKTFMFY